MPDSAAVIRSAKFQAMPDSDKLAIMRLWTVEDADPSANEPWCPDHGYGCEPQNCPCGHTLRCDCRSIADEH